MEALTSSCPLGFKIWVDFVLIWFWCSSSPGIPLLLILVVCLNLSFWGLFGWIKTYRDIWESLPPSGLGTFNSSTKIHSFEQFWENPTFLDGFRVCLRFAWNWVLMFWSYLLNTPRILPAKSQVNPSWFGRVLVIGIDFSWNMLVNTRHVWY